MGTIKLLSKKFWIILLVLTGSLGILHAQNETPASNQKGGNAPIGKLAMDPKIRYGKLDNGLTYYIRHNEMPKERADFYIVQNVGSMQEEETQRGLAHFLEHMAFNGTKNFPAINGIQAYTESIGMRFGENMNAYTSFDETVYMLIDAPVSRAGVVDSCLLILHDWSSFLLLTDEAIEKERKVIHEEWRTGRTAQQRLWEQQLPKMYPNCKYGERLPIGKIDVIDSFKGDELRAYYKKWYRPDLQALVIVGDIDVDQVEKSIHQMFTDIKAPKDPAERVATIVPDNEQIIASIATDKEMTNTILSIYYKHDKLPDALKGTIADFLTSYSNTVISLIMSERFSDIMQTPNKPFAAASAGTGDYFVSKTKGAWTTNAIVKEGEIERTMNALVAETERVKKFGFTEAEYERAKTNILKSSESLYNDRDKQENSSLANEYVRHFTDGEYIPGIEVEHELIQQIAASFPFEGINNYAKQLFDENKEKNVIISLIGPEKEGLEYPTELELVNMYRKANGMEILENEEEFIDGELISELPAPGKIISRIEVPPFNAILYTLGNGVRVVTKRTDYKEDEIVMTATSPGGTTLFSDPKDIYNLKIINNAIMLGGLGKFKATSLRKALSGKNVSCSIGIGNSDEYVNGSASPSDLKTLFELIYLEFTGMRTDDDAYASFKESITAQLNNDSLNPYIAFSDTVYKLMYDDDPRSKRFKASDFEHVDYHRIIDMYKERYADASDFVFTFVGNIDEDSIRPLMEQYLASLPSLGRKEKGDEKQVTPFRQGEIKSHFTRDLETPRSAVALMYSGNMPYTLKNAVVAQLLKQILDIRFLEDVRADRGATYAIQANIQMFDFPEGRTSIQIFFDTDPNIKDEIISLIKKDLNDVAEHGPLPDDLEKSRGNLRKNYEEELPKNSYWLGILNTYYSRGFDAHTEYLELLNSITADDIKNFTNKFLRQGNFVEVVMSPR